MIVIRSALFVVFFYLWCVTVCIAMVPLLLGPRKWVVWGLGVWGWLIIQALRVICGIRFEIRGREHMPTGKALIAAKHQCMFDTMCLWAELPDACYGLKKELVRIPFFGWYALKAGNYVIDREGHAKALRKLVWDPLESTCRHASLSIL